jgi:hypothetical protein
MSAKIDGVAWTANKKLTVTQGAKGVYTIDGKNTDASTIEIQLGLFNIGQTGTYPIGVGATIIGGFGILNVGANQWTSPMDYSGTLVITEISATRIKGTFAFAVLPTGAAVGLRNVTEGAFDLALTGTYSPPTDADGSSMVADTGTTQVLVAATIIGTYHDTTLNVSAITDRFTLSLFLKGIHGVGTYALSNVVPFRTVTLGAHLTTLPIDLWGGQPTDAGSVTITSLTATRIQGTFTATIQPTAGPGATAPVLVGGTFNLGMAQLP